MWVDKSMKLLGQVFGAIGLVLILSTPVMYFAVAAGWNWLFTVQIVLALVFLATYAATNVGELARIATGRGTFFVAFTVASSLAVIMLLTAGNYLASQSQWRLDLTTKRVFTLAPDSVGIVQALPETVEVLAFYRSDSPEYRLLEELVSRYRREGGEISLVALDPDREPTKMQEHQVNLRAARVIVRMGKRTERFSEISEHAMTNALLRLKSGSGKRVYFLEGHGEASCRDPEGMRGLGIVASSMENEGLEPAPLSIRTTIPKDAAALVIAGPQRSLLAPTLASLNEYLEEGGRALFLLEPAVTSGVEDLLESWGIGVEDDLIVDTNKVTDQMGPFVTMAATYAKHEITEQLGAMITLFPSARSLFPLTIENFPRPLPLALTGGDAFGAKAYRDTPVEYQPETDRRGPLPIAMVTTRKTPGGQWSEEARLVVFGDADFASNAWVEQAANSDLFLNSVNWLADQHERITIRPRRRAASQIFLTEGQQLFLSMFSINLLPLILAASGVAVWVLRKNR